MFINLNNFWHFYKARKSIKFKCGGCSSYCAFIYYKSFCSFSKRYKKEKSFWYFNWWIWNNGDLEIKNSYFLSFEEDINDPDRIRIFLYIYHENIFNMFKNINYGEKIIGWYPTGPDIKKNDFEINKILRKYNGWIFFGFCKVLED